MAKLYAATQTVLVYRPIEKVYAFFADGENDLKWRPGVKVMKRLGDLRDLPPLGGASGPAGPADGSNGSAQHGPRG